MEKLAEVILPLLLELVPEEGLLLSRFSGFFALARRNDKDSIWETPTKTDLDVLWTEKASGVWEEQISKSYRMFDMSINHEAIVEGINVFILLSWLKLQQGLTLLHGTSTTLNQALLLFGVELDILLGNTQ